MVVPDRPYQLLFPQRSTLAIWPISYVPVRWVNLLPITMYWKLSARSNYASCTTVRLPCGMEKVRKTGGLPFMQLTSYWKHKKAGFEVDKNVLNGILNYMNNRLKNKETILYYYNRDQKKKIAPKEVAYSLYVLALAVNLSERYELLQGQRHVVEP